VIRVELHNDGKFLIDDDHVIAILPGETFPNPLLADKLEVHEGLLFLQETYDNDDTYVFSSSGRDARLLKIVNTHYLELLTHLAGVGMDGGTSSGYEWLLDESNPESPLVLHDKSGDGLYFLLAPKVFPGEVPDE